MTAAPRIATGPIPLPAGLAGIAPLTDNEPWLPIRDTPHPDGASSMVWLVGAHGGAGVSTLAQMWQHAGDGGARWPGLTTESPYTVLVARDTAAGLDAAHLALRQYHTEHDIPARLLGLILVAGGPGNRTSEVRRLRQTVTSLAGISWSIPWLDQLLEVPIKALATADPNTLPQKRGKDLTHAVHQDIARLGTELRDLVHADASANN